MLSEQERLREVEELGGGGVKYTALLVTLYCHVWTKVEQTLIMSRQFQILSGAIISFEMKLKH